MTPAASRTVFVVDDDAGALAALVMLLRSNGYDARGFSSAQALLDGLTPDARGCIVSDLRMPGMDGLDLLEALKEIHCLLPVILVTGHADVALAVQAMKAGAADLLQKPFAAEQILRRVEACLAEHDGAVDAGARQGQVLARIESLTARERQVLDLIVAGASNKKIASSLEISPRTVEIYRANVMSKMRAENLSDLVRMTLLSRPA